MPMPLRIMLISIALLFLIISLLSVNRKRLQMHYSLIWIMVSIGMILLAVFPGILTWLMPILGIEIPANFVFLVGLFVLLVISFSLTVIVSKQSLKIRRLTQIFAIAQYLSEGDK